MAIIQISKIQLRSGNIDDLPQLSVGEMGWATDAKRLFIGNDPNVLGPVPDNTEILTQYSNLQAAGTNTQIQFNQANLFGASSAFTFDYGSNTLTLGGNFLPQADGIYDLGNPALQWGNLYLSGNSLYVGGQHIYVANDSFTTSNVAVTDTLTANNITIGDLSASGNLAVSVDGTFGGNVSVFGDLSVAGNVTYYNISTLSVSDPVIEMGGGPNGAPLTSNDGKDRGTLLHYYTTQPVDAFMGWDNSNGEFVFGSNVTNSSDVMTFNTLGNVRAANFIGNVIGNISGNISAPGFNTQVIFNSSGTFGTSANLTFNGSELVITGNANATVFNGSGAGLSNLPGANVTGAVSLANTANSVAGANVTGTVANANLALFANSIVSSSQPNITSVGTLTTLVVANNANIGGNLNVTGTINGNISGNISGNIVVPGSNTEVIFNNNGNAGASANLTFNGTVLSAPAFSGNGGGLSNIAGANVTGTVANSVSATTAGTVTTASQPNITSVGTLSSLTVSGNLTVDTNTLFVDSVSNRVFVGATAANFNISPAMQVGSIPTLDYARFSVEGNSYAASYLNTPAGSSEMYNSYGDIGLRFDFLGDGNVSNSYSTQIFYYEGYGNINGTELQILDNSITVKRSGNVGIANSSPTHTLSVGGTFYVSGNATTGGIKTDNYYYANGVPISFAGAYSNSNVANYLPTYYGTVGATAITTGLDTTAGTMTGNWTLTGSSQLNATYADLAEYYLTDQKYEAGTVLAFGGEAEVTISDNTNYQRIAGVVTTKPAYVMNTGIQENGACIALVGRVPVRVTGKINKGDLLRASPDHSGVAVADGDGGTIGRAIQSYDSEQIGTIEVMVGRT